MEPNHKMPELTLTPQLSDVPVQDEKALDTKEVLEQTLSPEEQQLVTAFAEKIDITNTNMVLQYGSAAQTKIADFSDMALQKVQTKDLGEVGELLTSLVTELRGFGEEEPKGGFFGLFKKPAKQVSQLKARYDKAEVNIEKVTAALESHQIQLMKDVALLDQLYEQNVAHFKELNMYLVAGKMKLNEVRSNELPRLVEQARRSGLPEDSQRANDMANFCDRFEKKVHDLELTRMVSIQMAPQIRLVQNNDTIMSEKIQTTLANTIPLWKSQMVIALGLSHSEQALAAQRQVSDLTNQLLTKNADALKMATIETAKESERGVVDMETLKYTNEALISTLDEVVNIQQEGREKRRAAEQELLQLEQQLKQKLLDIRS